MAVPLIYWLWWSSILGLPDWKMKERSDVQKDQQ